MTAALTSLACPAWSILIQSIVGWGPKKCLRNEHENQTISNEKDVTTVTKAKGAKQTGGYDDRLGLFSLSSLVNLCGLFAMPCQRETETKCDDDPQENACILFSILAGNPWWSSEFLETRFGQYLWPTRSTMSPNDRKKLEHFLDSEADIGEKQIPYARPSKFFWNYYLL